MFSMILSNALCNGGGTNHVMALIMTSLGWAPLDSCSKVLSSALAPAVIKDTELGGHTVSVLATLMSTSDAIKPSTVSGTGGREVVGGDGSRGGREGGCSGCDSGEGGVCKGSVTGGELHSLSRGGRGGRWVNDDGVAGRGEKERTLAAAWLAFAHSNMCLSLRWVPASRCSSEECL